MGLNFKLDVGLYRLDQQVACQRYRQTLVIANRQSTIKGLVNSFAASWAPKAPALSVA